MKKIFYTLLFVITASGLYAQTPFPALYYQPNSSVQSYCMIYASDSGFYTVGKYNDNGLLIHFDQDGSLLWSKQYNTGSGTVFNCVISSYDSCLVIAGHASGRVLLMKTTLSGDTLWAKGFEPSYSSTGLNVIQTSDSGFVVCGYAISPYSNTWMFIVKTDKSGNTVWAKTYSECTNINYAYSIKQTPENQFIVAGYSRDVIQKALMIKLDENGDTLWTKQYVAGTYENRFFDVVCTSDGYILSAVFDFRPALLKTDTAGNILWSKQYDGDISVNEYSLQPRLRLSNNNKILFPVRWENEGSFNNILFVTDTAGALEKKLTLDMMNSDIAETTDGGYFMTGNGPMIVFKNYIEIFWDQFGLIKLDSSFNSDECTYSLFCDADTMVVPMQSALLSYGTANHPVDFHPLISNAPLTYLNQCVCSIGGGLNEEKQMSLIIHPNPASNQISIELPKQSGEPGSCMIYDNTGKLQLLYTQKAGEINISNLSSGLYYVIVTTSENTRLTGKFIKK